MKKYFCSLLLLCLLLVSSVAGAVPAGTDISTGTVTASGVGLRPTDALTPTQAKLLARRVAINEAQRKLAEAVQAVMVDDETTVRSVVATNDMINTRINTLVKGAKVVAERDLPDGYYEVTLELPVYGVSGSLAQIVLPLNANPEDFPAPTIKPGSAATARYNTSGEGCYTGLIIDCRGLELQTALSPALLNEKGEKLYCFKNLDYQRSITTGVVAYGSEQTQARRAGSNPLRLTPVSLAGGVSPVLTQADADKMLSENLLTHFLDYSNVVFLR